MTLFSKSIHFLLIGKESKPEIEEVIIERLKEVKERLEKSRHWNEMFLENFCYCIKHLSYVQQASSMFKRHLFDLAFDLVTETQTHVSAFMTMSKEINNLMKANLKHATCRLAEKMTQKNPKDVVYDLMLVYRCDNISRFLERQLPILMTNLVFLASKKENGES